MNKITTVVLYGLLNISSMIFGMNQAQFIEVFKLGDDIPDPVPCTILKQVNTEIPQAFYNNNCSYQNPNSTLSEFDATIDPGLDRVPKVMAIHTPDRFVLERVEVNVEDLRLIPTKVGELTPFFICVPNNNNSSGTKVDVVYKITSLYRNLYCPHIRGVIQFKKPPLVQKIINNKHFPLLTFLCGSIITSIGFILYFNFFMSRT